MAVQDARVRGACEWLTATQSYTCDLLTYANRNVTSGSQLLFGVVHLVMGVVRIARDQLSVSL